MRFLQKFMYGRYGMDAFGVTLSFFALFLSFTSRFKALFFLLWVSYAILIYAIYRMLSKNVYRRREENFKFLKLTAPIAGFFKKMTLRVRDRKTHKYFACPACRQEVRVPRRNSVLKITCPKCGNVFKKKT